MKILKVDEILSNADWTKQTDDDLDIWGGDYTDITRADTCGAGSPGGGGFSVGNDCATGSGSSKDKTGFRVFYEVAPDPNNKELTAEWKATPTEERVRISEEISDEIVPRIINTVGAHAKVVEQLGGYEDDTNPSFAMLFPDGEDPQKIFDAMYMTGYALSQDSMLALSSKEFKGSFEVDLITLPTDSDPEAVHELYTKIRKATDNVVEGHTTIGNEMMIMVDAGTGEKLGKIIDSLTPAEHDVGVADGHAAFPEKKDYDYGSDQGQTSQLAGRRDDARKYRSEASARLEAELRKGKSRKTKRQLVWRPDREVIRQLLIQPRWRPLDLISRADPCGAGSEGGKGFSDGNTCAKGAGASAFANSTLTPKDFESMEKTGKIEHGEPSVRLWDYANYLDKRFRESGLEKVPDDLRKISPEQLEELTQRVSDVQELEVESALELEKTKGVNSGKYWYTKDYQKFKGELASALNDPTLADPKSTNAGIFDLMMATTSSGQSVQENLKIAATTYQLWRRAGTLKNLGGIGAGKESKSIQKTLNRIQVAADSVGGYDNLIELAKKDVSVKFLREKFNLKLKGKADATVPGSYILGPKLGRFYANIAGNATELVIDRHQSRNIRQSMGSVAATPSPEAYREQVSRLEAVINGTDFIPASTKTKKNPKGKVTKNGPLEKSKPVTLSAKATFKDEKERLAFPKETEDGLHGFSKPELLASATRVKKQGYGDWEEPIVQWARKSSLEYARLDFGTPTRGLGEFKTEKRQATHTFFKGYNGANDTVGETIRAMAEEATRRTVDRLRAKGHKDINISTIQAITWTNFKRVMAEAGVVGEENSTYSEALATLVAEGKLLLQ